MGSKHVKYLRGEKHWMQYSANRKHRVWGGGPNYYEGVKVVGFLSPLHRPNGGNQG